MPFFLQATSSVVLILYLSVRRHMPTQNPSVRTILFLLYPVCCHFLCTLREHKETIRNINILVEMQKIRDAGGAVHTNFLLYFCAYKNPLGVNRCKWKYFGIEMSCCLNKTKVLGTRTEKLELRT